MINDNCYILTISDTYYFENIDNNYYKKELKVPFNLYIRFLYELNDVCYYEDVITKNVLGIKKCNDKIRLYPGYIEMDKSSLRVDDECSYLNTLINSKDEYIRMSNSIIYESFVCDVLSYIYDVPYIPENILKEEIGNYYKILDLKKF